MSVAGVVEILQLDRERVLASASATEDHAARAETADIALASEWAVAASLWSLLDPPRATEAFAHAAAAYAELRSPWAAVLAVCADVRRPSHLSEWEPDRPLFEHARPEAAVLSQLWPFAANAGDYDLAGALDTLASSAGRATARPVGRLRIPLEHYLALGWAMSRLNAQDGDLSKLQLATAAFLRRVDEFTRMAQVDSYHWARLRPGVLPVEPEAIAASAIVSLASRTITGTLASEMLAPHVDSRELAPVLVAEALMDVEREEGVPA